MTRLTCAALLSLIALGGCKKEAPAVAAGTAESGQPAAAAAAGAEGASPEAAEAGEQDEAANLPKPVADPGPKLEFRAGDTKATVLEAIDGKATGLLVQGGHVWLDVQAPAAAGRGPSGMGGMARQRVRVLGERHGVATMLSDGNVLVRLVGEERPTELELEVESSASFGWNTHLLSPGQLRKVRVAVGEKLDAPADLRTRFFKALAGELRAEGDRVWNRRSDFHAFAAGRADALAAGKPGAPLAAPPTAREPSTDVGETMRLYTGMTSVSEALQADRGLLLRRGLAEESTELLSEIEGVPMPEHPWEKMLKDAGKTPTIEPLASLVPADTLYVYFHDLRTAAKLLREAQEWMTPAIRAVEARSANYHLIERYERELMIEHLGLAETLGNIAAKGVAICVGDPFAREGTDVAIAFHVKSRAILLGALTTYEKRARERTPDLVESSWTVGEHTVRVVSAPDGSVNQHRIELGELLVIANSRPAIERFLKVADGEAEPLAKSGDFRWMRSEYPWSEEAEDGFVFIGDAFVQRAISPRSRILQARRMEARADLLAVGFSQLMHGLLEGKPAASAKALIAAGLLAQAELSHGDGSPIALDPVRGAHSERWGRPAAMKPLAELPLEKVTPAERAAYERFRQTYQSYWRGYVDPVAVRLVRSPDGKKLSADARILPLIANTEYDDLADIVGASRIKPPTVRSGLQWTLAVGADTRMRRELDGMSRAMKLGGFGWLGDWVMVGAASRSGLWDLALLDDMLPQAPAAEDPDDPDGLERLAKERQMWSVGARAPIYVGAHIGNPVAFASTLTALRAMADSTAPGMVVWDEAEPYRDVRIVRIGAGPGQGNRMGMAEFKIHYAIVQSVFVASPDLGTVQTVIDDVMAGRSSAQDKKAERQADLRLGLDPAEPWLGRALVALIQGQERAALWRSTRDLEVLAAGLGGMPEAGDARREAAMGFFGYEPSAGPVGNFVVDGEGRLVHDVFGPESAPRFPKLPLEGAELTKLVESLEGLSFGVAFEGEGETRGLHATMEWSRR